MARLIAVVVMLAAATTVAGAEGRDDKCWHLALFAFSNNGQEWLNKEDANGYELVAIAPSGVNPTVTYLTRSTHPGDCQTPDAAQRRAEQEQQARREVETRLAQESAARRVAEARVVELEAFLRQLRQAVGIDPTE